MHALHIKVVIIPLVLLSMMEIVEGSSSMLQYKEEETPISPPSDDITTKSSGSGLRWKDLSVVLHNGVPILNQSCGFIQVGHVCGVIGPSGSGKSTLLAALAGTTLRSTKLQVLGHVWYDHNNNHDDADNEEQSTRKLHLSTSEGEVALLQQEDVFFSMLTPYETLDLAAKLQLPHHVQDEERESMVNQLIDSLGLSKVKHRRVGDRKVGGEGAGGLSGGEMRRLSVAVELITTPKLLLADEPTTGLDSNQAAKVMALISKVSKEKMIPTICTLHQPRTSIWQMLDSFILLAPGGRVCYVGMRKDAREYFSKLGYKCPSEMNPAEFFIDLVSIDTEDPEQASIDNKRIDYLTYKFTEHSQHLKRKTASSWAPPRPRKRTVLSDTRSSKTKNMGAAKRFANLLMRSWRQNIRDVRLNILRLTASVGQSFLFAQIFKTVSKGIPTGKSVADRTALLSFGVINMCMLALMKAMELFSREKDVVTRERMRQQYTGVEYLLSKIIAEFPLDAVFATLFAATLKWKTGLRCSLQVLCSTFSLMTVAGASLGYAIGSISPNADAAKATGFPIMIILMVVGIINPGGVDPKETQPRFLEWLRLISPIRWAIEALCIAEYRGMEFARLKKGFFRTLLTDVPRMGGLALVENGDQVLDALGLAGKSWEDSMWALAKLTGANLLLCLFGLSFCSPSVINSRGYNGAHELPANDGEIQEVEEVSKVAGLLSTERTKTNKNASYSGNAKTPLNVAYRPTPKI
eukprot:CAMPEP_0116011248 /NCGR_PEP_ID=MMETSP0321-20121206/4461_1 /TAXON_ID=163516 /ORGANISM="Leptocylindrus danicus var. danicus, Strain B650" /LENGTH=748 /DNA_ID=CAMNT_0003480457 /DNA_START=81 /DNA_END=2327 /DNA_ORIENTATION=-